MFTRAIKELKKLSEENDGKINDSMVVEVAQSLRGREWLPLYRELFNYLASRPWKEISRNF